MNFQGYFDDLMLFYKKNARKLPWRGSKNPYVIWVSEIILQQTRVAQGTDYFMTFLRYFPDINSLAKAKDDEVLHVWQGLGYYSRALNMLNAAREIVEKYQGEFPNKYSELLQIKGIGPYTAAAIASIAFEQPHAAIDGNLLRVAARLFGLTEDISKASTVKTIADLLNEAIIHYAPGDFNQALMELGATICTPKNPKCTDCPMSSKCVAFAKQLQHVLPNKAAKKKPEVLHLAFFHFDYAGETLIVKRDHAGIWKGLYEFPNAISTSTESPENMLQSLGIDAGPLTLLDCKKFVHKLTHKTIFADFWHISGMPYNIVKENDAVNKIRFDGLKDFPVHRLMQKYLDSLMKKEKIKEANNDK